MLNVPKGITARRRKPFPNGGSISLIEILEKDYTKTVRLERGFAVRPNLRTTIPPA